MMEACRGAAADGDRRSPKASEERRWTNRPRCPDRGASTASDLGGMHLARDDAVRRPEPLRRSLAWLSAVLCLALSGLYLLRPLNVDPITVWPFWFWAVIGLALAPFTLRRCRPAVGVLPLILWALAVVTIAEEPVSMLRLVLPAYREVPAPAPGETRLKVVSLNCDAGHLAAVEDALARDPDLLLLQEAPSRHKLEQLLADRPHYSMVTGADCAVITRGVQRELPEAALVSRCAAASEVRLDKAPMVRMVVVSIHLLQPVLRYDIWNPTTWREGSGRHKARLEWLRPVAEVVRAHAAHTPVLLGGDFNTPGGDSILRTLSPPLRDAHKDAGSGWPNTFMSHLPLSRIDQLWLSPCYEALSLKTRKTEHSDHRMIEGVLRLKVVAVDMGGRVVRRSGGPGGDAGQTAEVVCCNGRSAWEDL